MQGVRSSSVQLRLMKEMPPTLEDALKLASQLEAVEEAQKRLQKDRCQAESLALTEDAQGRRSRGGWGGYCPPKYRGGGAQPPLALPSGYE